MSVRERPETSRFDLDHCQAVRQDALAREQAGERATALSPGVVPAERPSENTIASLAELPSTRSFVPCSVLDWERDDVAPSYVNERIEA